MQIINLVLHDYHSPCPVQRNNKHMTCGHDDLYLLPFIFKMHKKMHYKNHIYGVVECGIQSPAHLFKRCVLKMYCKDVL